MKNGHSDKVQYLIDGEKYIPTGKSISQLPPGYYVPSERYSVGHFLARKEVISEETIIFPDSVVSEILTNIKVFWESRHKYVDYGFVYKRGILLYGVPGTGKTSVINAICNHIIKSLSGIVITISDHEELKHFKVLCQYIRDIEPDKPIILLFEDIDNLFGGDDESLLLNLLDGKFQIENVVYIATTNYPDKLAERIINRPSRFDLVREIALPNAEVRRYYLKTKLKEDDLAKYPIEEWVDKTEGLSIAHIKEAILSVVIQGEDFNEVMERMREVVRKVYKPISIEKESKEGIGFLKKR